MTIEIDFNLKVTIERGNEQDSPSSAEEFRKALILLMLNKSWANKSLYEMISSNIMEHLSEVEELSFGDEGGVSVRIESYKIVKE